LSAGLGYVPSRIAAKVFDGVRDVNIKRLGGSRGARQFKVQSSTQSTARKVQVPVASMVPDERNTTNQSGQKTIEALQRPERLQDPCGAGGGDWNILLKKN
jgi:hypothetical protein